MSPLTEVRHIAPIEVSAHQWRRDVLVYANHRGWLAIPSKMTRFWVLVRALPDGDRRIVFAEMIGADHELSNRQRERATALALVADLCREHVEMHVWRPADRRHVVEVLR